MIGWNRKKSKVFVFLDDAASSHLESKINLRLFWQMSLLKIWMQVIWPPLSSFTCLMLLWKTHIQTVWLQVLLGDRKILLISIQLWCSNHNVSNFHARQDAFLSIFWGNVRWRDRSWVLSSGTTACSSIYTLKIEISCIVQKQTRNYRQHCIQADMEPYDKHTFGMSGDDADFQRDLMWKERRVRFSDEVGLCS